MKWFLGCMKFMMQSIGVFRIAFFAVCNCLRNLAGIEYPVDKGVDIGLRFQFSVICVLRALHTAQHPFVVVGKFQRIVVEYLGLRIQQDGAVLGFENASRFGEPVFLQHWNNKTEVFISIYRPPTRSLGITPDTDNNCPSLCRNSRTIDK